MTKLTLEEVAREIAAWPDANSKPKSIDALDSEQRKILCLLMRSGKRMDQISDWWKEQGLPGYSPGTLRRMFKELEGLGY